jgi:hypothetical protein
MAPSKIEGLLTIGKSLKEDSKNLMQLRSPNGRLPCAFRLPVAREVCVHVPLLLNGQQSAWQ